MRLKVVIVALLMSTCLLLAQNTKRRIASNPASGILYMSIDTLNTVTVDTASDSLADAVRFCLFNPKNVRISGYEKRASDYRETFFITNNTDYPISGVEVNITYMLLSGEQIHKTRRMVRAEIPAKETRKVDISGFDTQRQFYYYKSKAPRKGGTPYKISVQVTRYDIIAR